MKKLTKSDRKHLAKLNTKTWTFIPRSPLALWYLENDGLVVSELRLKEANFATGSRHFQQAYKLTEAGQQALAEQEVEPAAK